MTAGTVLAGHGSTTVGPGFDALDVFVPDTIDTDTGLVVRGACPSAPVIMPLGAALTFNLTSPGGRAEPWKVSTCGLAVPIDAGETLVQVPSTHAVAPVAASNTKPVGRVIVTDVVPVPAAN